MPKVTGMVSFICDPYVALFWQMLYQKYFKDELDELVVGVNGPLTEVLDFIISLFPNSSGWTIDETRNQGRMFDGLYPFAKGNVLAFFDSDNFIFKRGLVSNYAKMVPTYDIIGSTGLFASKNVVSLVEKRYGLARINPFMSFWNKGMLDRISDRRFEAIHWEKEYQLPGTDIYIKGAGHLDHFSQATLQMLQQGAKYLKIPPEALPDYIHVSSMGAGVRLFFERGDGKTIYGYQPRPEEIGKDIMSWYWLVYHQTKDQYPDEKFNQMYLDGMRKKISEAKYYNEADIEQLANEKRRFYAD